MKTMKLYIDNDYAVYKRDIFINLKHFINFRKNKGNKDKNNTCNVCNDDFEDNNAKNNIDEFYINDKKITKALQLIKVKENDIIKICVKNCFSFSGIVKRTKLITKSNFTEEITIDQINQSNKIPENAMLVISVELLSVEGNYHELKEGEFPSGCVMNSLLPLFESKNWPVITPITDEIIPLYLYELLLNINSYYSSDNINIAKQAYNAIGKSLIFDIYQKKWIWHVGKKISYIIDIQYKKTKKIIKSKTFDEANFKWNSIIQKIENTRKENKENNKDIEEKENVSMKLIRIIDDKEEILRQIEI